MLVLSRRVGEKICIPELNITLQVVGLKGNSVRLGIDAPPEIRIMRSEVMDSAKDWSELDDSEYQPTVREARPAYRCQNLKNDPASIKGKMAV